MIADATRVERWPTGRAARNCSRVLLVIAVIALSYSVFWAFGPRAVELENHHCGNVVSNYIHPHALDPQLEAGYFSDPARMCNTDAVRQMHRIYLFTATSACLLLAAMLYRHEARQTST